MIYTEEQKPRVTKLRRRQQHKFYDFNLNPITGFREIKHDRCSRTQTTAEVIDFNKPGFRLAI